MKTLYSAFFTIAILLAAIPALTAAVMADSPNLTVSAKDDKGNPLTGYWIEVRQAGTVVKTGFSPASFNLATGSYTVSVADYGSYYFNKWSDGTTNREHAITIGSTGTVSLTAIYATTQAPPPPSDGISISSAYVDGSSLVGMYVALQQNGATIDSGFTTKKFSVTVGQQYTIIPSDYTNAYFNKWSDGSNTRAKTVTATSTGIDLTAQYTTSPESPPPTPDFSVAASPSSLNIVAGESGTSTITTTSLNGFSSAVTLSASPAITGVTTTFSVNPVTPTAGGSKTTTLTIATSSTAAAGTYTLTVTGKSGTMPTHSATITVTISTTAPPPPGDNLAVNIKDDKGNPLTGYWIDIKQGTSTVKTGYSPASFNLATGSYTVSVADYGSYYFNKWSDGTTNREHAITIGSTGTVSLTAIYATTQAPPPPPPPDGAPNTVTVKSTDLNGNTITGMYVNVRLNGNIIKDGFTPVTFSLDPGSEYVVVMYWCCDNEFRHYSDGTLTRYHYVTPDATKGINLEANYEVVPASQAATLNVIAKDTNGNVIGGTTGSAEDGTLIAKPGMWMWITPPGASSPYSGAYSSSSSTPFKVFNGKTYTIAMSSFDQYVFDHWQDDSSNTNPTRAFTLNGDSVNNVAVYRIVATASSTHAATSSSSAPPSPWYDVDN
jgi:hypothetical protein